MVLVSVLTFIMILLCWRQPGGRAEPSDERRWGKPRPILVTNLTHIGTTHSENIFQPHAQAYCKLIVAITLVRLQSVFFVAVPPKLCNSALVLLYRKVKISLNLKIDPVTIYSYIACCHEGGNSRWCSHSVQVLFVSDKKYVVYAFLATNEVPYFDF